MRLHPEEGLTDGDEAGDMQHPSRVEPTQELVSGVPKPALMEGDEGYNLVGPGVRNYLARCRSSPMRHLLR